MGTLSQSQKKIFKKIVVVVIAVEAVWVAVVNKLKRDAFS